MRKKKEKRVTILRRLLLPREGSEARRKLSEQIGAHRLDGGLGLGGEA